MDGAVVIGETKKTVPAFLPPQPNFPGCWVIGFLRSHPGSPPSPKNVGDPPCLIRERNAEKESRSITI